MIKNLVTLGDSWVYGDELGDDEYRQQHAWPRLVADHFGMTLQNLGFNGESLQSTIWSALWWLDNQYREDSLIIVGLTQAWRTSWFRASHQDDSVPWSAHANIASLFDIDEYQQMKKLYINHSDCEKLQKFNRRQALSFFDGLPKTNDVEVLQFDIYSARQQFFGLSPEHLPYGSSHMYPGESAAEWVGTHVKPHKHPDETGHDIIAKKLISWIESAKLA